MSNFIDDALAGRALLEDIDERIADWHALPAGTHGRVEDYLGMTWDEYRLWAEKPASLKFIFRARKDGKKLDDVLSETTTALAARSDDAREAQLVLDWLRERGRI